MRLRSRARVGPGHSRSGWSGGLCRTTTVARTHYGAASPDRRPPPSRLRRLRGRPLGRFCVAMRHPCPPSLAQARYPELTRGGPQRLVVLAAVRSGAAGTTSASSPFASCSGFASSAPNPSCVRPRHRAGPAVGGASCPSPCNALSPALRSGCGPCRRCRGPRTHSKANINNDVNTTTKTNTNMKINNSFNTTTTNNSRSKIRGKNKAEIKFKTKTNTRFRSVT